MAAAAMVVDSNCVANINALLESKKPVNQMVLSSKNMGWLITKLVWHHPKFCATPTTEPSR